MNGRGRGWRWWPAAACACVLLTLTHLPPRGLDRIPIHVWDKLAHFSAYCVLGGLVAWASAGRGLRPSAMRLAAALAVFAALDELTQPMAGRDCELDDWLADVLGMGIGLSVVWLGTWLAGAAGRDAS